MEDDNVVDFVAYSQRESTGEADVQLGTAIQELIERLRSNRHITRQIKAKLMKFDKDQ